MLTVGSISVRPNPTPLLKKTTDAGTTKPSRQNPAFLPKPSPTRNSAATGTASSPKLAKGSSSRLVKEESQRKVVEDDDSMSGLRGGRMTPQPLFMGRTGGPPGGDSDDEEEKAEDGRGKSGRIVALHRGLVITNELRKELLNPLSHRFKLLRGAH